MDQTHLALILLVQADLVTLCGEVCMRLEAVGKRYGLRQPWIVRDVSLDVPPGRLIRLKGRNGSGKSTLLRVASGGVATVNGAGDRAAARRLRSGAVQWRTALCG